MALSKNFVPIFRISDKYFGSLSIRFQSVSTSNEKSQRKIHAADISFENPQLAYQSKTTWEVLRSWMVLSFCKHEFLVDRSEKMVKLGRKILGPTLFRKLMKATFFGQFVAGENVEEIRPLIRRMRRFGPSVILNYAVEDDEENSQQKKSGIMILTDKEDPHDVNAKNFMKCIDDMADVTNGAGFAAIKVTALAKPQTLIAVTDAIKKSQAFVNSIMDNENNLPITATCIPMAELKRKLVEKGHDLGNPGVQLWLKNLALRGELVIDALNWKDILDCKMALDEVCYLPKSESETSLFGDLEREGLYNLARRLDAIAEHAYRKKMRVLVDAEQSYFQPAIARLSLELMRRYNKDNPTIYNTYQCYLRDAYINVMPHLELSRQENFMFGAKVVRGAYIVLERERASQMGYPDPINPNFDSTTAMYEKVVGTILEDVVSRGDRSNIVIAGHNEHTVRWAVDKLHDLKIPQKTRQVYFGQLLGMCDQLSFTLAHSGFNVVKCVPYGSVEEVLPYLIRRAHENRGFMEKTTKERSLLRKELMRRLVTGKFFSNPDNISSDMNLAASTKPTA